MNTSDIYREEIIDHSKHPRNFGKIAKPDVRYKEKNPLCGDEIELFVKLDSHKKVKAVAFNGAGCVISRASASLFTEAIKGKSVRELEQLSAKDALECLGLSELTPTRQKCALLVLETLKRGLKKYQQKTK
ncbi:MAG: SUF system NifU family Fe-S cluster assembly protein [Candidatus Kerfeldbacteria bacterium CG08_land_8_20_14_0_20_40_16]|uniref:SUF system NifU family Fe-S cluster assembly protein n=1 Tax=Candidatus Kerfeldbacteria bacterium CG08_land_8_20_14_0_20_40_16 TaxID=2014244 RepID=A0A2H0YV27_9BACT|nr:MAG: SUF system NifU family Fe-S cluster assembly protein [Candidatus Kerfeldbacteria bacterium CG08_land_8_20_14_0_20_40_16]